MMLALFGVVLSYPHKFGLSGPRIQHYFGEEECHGVLSELWGIH